jgi:anti-sigma factor RsiW
MNHHLYEEWLFASLDPTEQALTEEQAAALQEHLPGCESCRALAESWRQVETQLERVEQLAPPAGFASRWQERLEVERQRTHRRQTTLALACGIVGAMLLLGVLLVSFWPWLQSPAVLVWAGLYRLFALAFYFLAAREFVVSLFSPLVRFLPAIWLALFAGLVCELVVLWIVSLRFLTEPRRVTK